MPRRSLFFPVLIAALALASASNADDDPLLAWSQTAARGLFDLCRQDAPDAAIVAEHGEIWGWPPIGKWISTPPVGRCRCTYAAAPVRWIQTVRTTPAKARHGGRST